VLTNASATLKFDGFSFIYTTTAGNYIEFSTPGVFGPGTASFLICSSVADCEIGDAVTLYLTGTITNLGTLASQVGGLSGDAGASPSEFDFLRNFSDGSQTELQGSLGTPAITTPVPEPLTAGTIGPFLLIATALQLLRSKQRGLSQSITSKETLL
jgi:hypothetical protein